MELIGRTIGGYRLVATLGKGGMGTVYRAEGPGGRVVALKVLQKGQARVSERFRREGELLARVGNHPHIVAIHGAGQQDELPFIVMELVDGGSLEGRLPRPVTDSARIVEEVARAVAHLHALGVVHRDIKPGNVLVGEDGRARLTDFGLARDLARTTRLTGQGQIVGTPFYMAPEMLRGADPDEPQPGEPADVYALGALLFACLAGRPPYEARTLAELVGLVMAAPVPRPGAVVPGVPRDLDAIVVKALAKEPADRYPSALAVAEDLARFRRGEPVQARPVSGLVRLLRQVRREPRRAATLATLVLLTLAAGPLVRGAWLWIDREVERTRKEAKREEFARAVDLATAAAAAEARAAAPDLGPGGDPRRASVRVERALAALDALPAAPPGARGVDERARAARAALLVALARAERALGDDARVLEHLQLAASLAPPDAELHARLAEAAAAAGDLATADAALAAIPASSRGETAAQRARGVVLVARGKNAEAAQLLEGLAASRSDPEATFAYAQALLGRGDPRGCLAALDLAKERQRTAGAAEWRLQARAHAALGEDVEAERELSRAVVLAPRDAELALEHARFLVARGEAERARRAAEPLRVRRGAACDVVAAQGRLLRGALDPALALVESASRSSSGDAVPALLLLSALHRSTESDRYEEARAAFERADTEALRHRAALELGRAELLLWERERPASERTAAPTVYSMTHRPGDATAAIARAEAAFDEAARSHELLAAANAGLVRVALARGQLARAATLIGVAALSPPGDAEAEDPDAVFDFLLARAERAHAARDTFEREAVRDRARALRLLEDAAPLPSGLARRPRREASLELAAAIEHQALRLLAVGLRTKRAAELAAADRLLALAVALAPAPRRLALLARARLARERSRDALLLAWRSCLLDPGVPGAARTFLEAALATDDRLAEALEASEVLLAREALGADETLAVRSLRARAKLRLGDRNGAREELDLATVARPKQPVLLRALAAVERRAGDAAAATAHEVEARRREAELRELAPKHDEATRSTNMFSDAGQPLTDQRLELEPYYGKAYQDRAAYRLIGGDIGGALFDFARNAAIDGSAAYEFLDWTDRAMGRQMSFDPPTIRGRIAAEPSDRITRLYARALGELLAYETGLSEGEARPSRSQPARLDEAVRDLDRVLALDPEVGCALVFRGRCLQRLGRRDSARADLEAALLLDDRAGPLARYFLATLEAQEGANDRALEHLEAARGWSNVKLRAKADPDLEGARKSPAFAEWLRRAD